MTPSNQSSPRKFTFTHLLMGAIVLLLVVIVFQSFSGKNENSGTVTQPAKDGVSNPQKPLDEESKPTRVDTRRLTQTYPVGKSYRTIVQASLTSHGKSKNWGIAADSSFAYIAELEVDRTIDSNDGTKMVITQVFPAAKTLTATAQIDGFHIDLSSAEKLKLEGLNLVASAVSLNPLPPGWIPLVANSANAVLESTLVKNLITEATKDKNAKLIRRIDSIEGKRMKVEVKNGEGLTNVIPIGSALTGEEVDLVRFMNYSCDATILPQDSKPGDTWTLRAADLMTLFDPSMKARSSGSVTAQRLPDQVVDGRNTARIEIVKGVVELIDTTNKDVTNATWAPRGVLTFDFKDSIITSAELDGELIIQNHSTDHIIFEASWSQQPKYKVVYHSELKK